MKKKIIPIVFILVVGILVLAISNNLSKIKYNENIYTTFQETDFLLLDPTPSSWNENILISIFDTHCDICELEFSEYKLKPLENIDILFVSPEPIDSIRNFAKKNSCNNIYFAQIDSLQLIGKYKPRSIPYYIFYQNNILTESGKGFLSPEKLQYLIQNINK